jgi:hypothetical protein
MYRFPTILSVALAVSGCSQPEYRASASKFGEATQLATNAQQARFQTLSDTETTAIRQEMAQSRVLLRASVGCATLFVPGADANACFVETSDGAQMPQANSFPNIMQLNGAFSAYGKQLAGVAANSDEDAAAFSASLIELAASADELNAALTRSTTPDANVERLDRSATVVGLVLSAAEGASRTAKLRRIIVAADPSVQQVAMQLNAASEAVLSAEIQQAFSDVETAQTDLQTSVARGRPTATIAAKQATLIQRVDTLRRISAVNGSFAQLAQTHTALADAARSGISDNDFETSILELITLIKTLRETL